MSLCDDHMLTGSGWDPTQIREPDHQPLLDLGFIPTVGSSRFAPAQIANTITLLGFIDSLLVDK